jgi:Bacterial Ig-like domain (group 2)
MVLRYDPIHVTGWTRSQMVSAVPPIALTVGETQRIVAADRTFAAQAICVSDTPAVASIDAAGLITAVSPGTAAMGVTDGAFSATADVVVSAP